MAFTVNRKKHTCGDMRMMILSCTADAATQTIETGLNNVVGFSMTPISMTSNTSSTIYPNQGAEGTATAGVMGVSNVTSGDEFMLIVYGN